MKVRYKLIAKYEQDNKVKTLCRECETERAADEVQYDLLSRLSELGGRLLEAAVQRVRYR